MTTSSSPASSDVARRQFLAGGAGVGAVALAGCLGGGLSNGTRTERYAVDPGLALRVIADDGRVRVLGDASVDRVEVRSTVAANDLGNPLERAPLETAIENDQFVVHARAERGDGFLASRVTHDVEVRVPDGLSVARVETANGAVDVSGVAGDVEARSRNGDVTVSNVDRILVLESGNGDVTAVATRSVASARTANGDVDVELVTLERDADVRSTNGDVTVRVDPALAAVVDLEAGNGRVQVRDVAVDRDVDERRRVVGRLGDGEHRIRARTGNGTVTLRAR